MAQIKKVLRLENKGEWANVIVQLEDGSEASVYVGGSVETWFSYGKACAFIKKKGLTSTGRSSNIDKEENNVTK